MDLLSERYEPALSEARSRLENDPTLRLLMADDCPADLFHLWAIRWSAHGVRMTEQVEHWIAWAGERCQELGLTSLGKALKTHAHTEAGHEKMMMDDARSLVERWNETAKVPLDGEALIASSPLFTARKYVELHETVIGGERPYCQVAIEYEIERLSVIVGPHLLVRWHRLLGKSGDSFLAEHIELDHGHTAFNKRQLLALLDERESDLVPLVETGREALRVYFGFMTECLELAKADLDRELNA